MLRGPTLTVACLDSPPPQPHISGMAGGGRAHSLEVWRHRTRWAWRALIPVALGETGATRIDRSSCCRGRRRSVKMPLAKHIGTDGKALEDGPSEACVTRLETPQRRLPGPVLFCRHGPLGVHSMSTPGSSCYRSSLRDRASGTRRTDRRRDAGRHTRRRGHALQDRRRSELRASRGRMQAYLNPRR